MLTFVNQLVTGWLESYPHILELLTKRKKEAKKEKRVEIWKTEGVSHIPTRQAIIIALLKNNR